MQAGEGRPACRSWWTLAASVWYRWTAPTPLGEDGLSGLVLEFGSFAKWQQLALSVYAGNPATSLQVACAGPCIGSWPECGPIPESMGGSIQFAVEPGRTYYFQLATDIFSDRGSFVLEAHAVYVKQTTGGTGLLVLGCNSNGDALGETLGGACFKASAPLDRRVYFSIQDRAQLCALNACPLYARVPAYWEFRDASGGTRASGQFCGANNFGLTPDAASAVVWIGPLAGVPNQLPTPAGAFCGTLGGSPGGTRGWITAAYY